MDTLSYKLIFQLIEKKRHFGIADEVWLPVIASILTIIFTILYNNFRENRRISRRLDEKEEYITWIFDYLEMVIPMRIVVMRQIISGLESRKKHPEPISEGWPIDAKLLEIIYNQDLYDAIIKRRKASNAEKNNFFNFLQLNFSGLLTANNTNPELSKELQELFNMELEELGKHSLAVQAYLDELTTLQRTNKATEKQLILKLALDPLFEKTEDSDPFEKVLETFLKPIFEIGNKYSDPLLVSEARAGIFFAEGLIERTDTAIEFLNHYIINLEVVLKFLQEEVRSFMERPVKRSWIKLWL